MAFIELLEKVALVYLSSGIMQVVAVNYKQDTLAVVMQTGLLEHIHLKIKILSGIILLHCLMTILVSIRFILMASL